MKQRFRQSLSTVLLYLLSVLIIFILIGSITFVFAYIAAYFTQFSPITIFAWMLFILLASRFHSCLAFLSHRLFGRLSAREG